MNKTIQEVTCTADQKLATWECLNERTVSIQIKKTDSVLNTSLDGATFGLYEAVSDGQGGWTAGEKLTEGVTANDGVLVFGDLSPNTTYIVREEAAPDGYVTDSKDHVVTTNTDAKTPEELPVSNVPEGTLIVEKHDTFNQKGDSYELFEGVTFTLYKAADANADTPDADTGKTEIGSKTTVDNGRASWEGLEPGTYWLVETLPEGYRKDGNTTDFRKVKVSAGENSEIARIKDIETIDNTAVMGKLQIGKYAFDENGKVDEGEPLRDVEFTLYQDSGCTRPVTYADGSNVVLTTGADGTALSGWITPETYYLKETKAKDGYVLSETVYTVEVTANAITTSSEANTDLTKIGNEKTGGFSIVKYGAFITDPDAEPDAQEDVLEQLSGATFAVYPYVEAEDGALTDKPALAPGTKRDSVQTFTMKNYTETVTGLEPGTYWLRETAAPNNTWNTVADTLVQIYPDGTARYGTLGEDGKVTWSGASAAPSITLKDYSKQPRIRFIKKVHGEETVIDGARFELYVQVEDGAADIEPTIVDSKGTKVWLVPVTDSNGNTVTIDSGDARDENGKQIHGEAVTPKLEPGHTYYSEIARLVGSNNNGNYYFDTENCWTSVYIPPEAEGQEFSTVIENYRKTHLPGYKYEGTDENSPLSGSLVAVFRDKEDADAMVERMHNYKEWDENSRLKAEDIYNAETGELTEQAKAWGILQVAVSDGTGKYEFADLIPGETYYIMELVAPNGYQLEKDDQGNFVYHTVKVSDSYSEDTPFASVDGNPDVHKLAISNWDFNQIVLDKVSVLSGQEYRISGATFTIYGSKTENGELKPDTANVIGILNESNNKGQYMSNHLPNGIYWVAETQPPAGFTEAERDALNEADQETFGAKYDYMEYNGTRYYKVVLGRDEDNTWFTEKGGHEIYNVAEVGRFALTKVNAQDENEKLQATFDVAKYDSASGEFVTYGNYPSITTSASEPYVLSNFLEDGVYCLTETGTDDRFTMDGRVIYLQIEGGKITDGTDIREIKVNGQPLLVDGQPVKGYLPVDETDLSEPITVDNAPKGQFYIHKTGTWNGGADNGGTTENLEGVTFEVYQKFTEVAGDTTLEKGF